MAQALQKLIPDLGKDRAQRMAEVAFEAKAAAAPAQLAPACGAGCLQAARHHAEAKSAETRSSSGRRSTTTGAGRDLHRQHKEGAACAA